jgi:hypothetical protein
MENKNKPFNCNLQVFDPKLKGQHQQEKLYWKVILQSLVPLNKLPL